MTLAPAVASRVSGWCWSRLDFYSSVTSRVLASVQPIRLSKNLSSEMQFDWKKILFPLTLTTLTAPAAYCEPGLRLQKMSIEFYIVRGASCTSHVMLTENLSKHLAAISELQYCNCFDRWCMPSLCQHKIQGWYKWFRPPVIEQSDWSEHWSMT